MLRNRASGILEELLSSANSTEELVSELTYDRGYPEEVAERIAYGELDMRPEARAERMLDFTGGDTTTFYHGGYIPGNELKVNKLPEYNEPSLLFATPDPFLSNTYVPFKEQMNRHNGQIYPLKIDRSNFLRTNVGTDNWSDIEVDKILKPDGRLFDMGSLNKYQSTDGLGELARRHGYSGITIDDVVDVGPNYRMARELFDDNENDFWRKFSALENGSEVLAVNDMSTVRSANAAFDPEYKGRNTLGAAAAAGIGLGALGTSDDAMSAEERYGTIEPYEPGMVEGAVQSVAQFFKDAGLTDSDYTANQMASSISDLADFTPVVGDAKGFAEARDAFEEGNYGEAALLGGLGVLGLVPMLGDVAAGAIKGAMSTAAAPMRQINPKMTQQAGGSQNRKFDQKRGEAIDFTVEDRPLEIPSETLSLADFEGRPYMFGQSDRSRAGGILTQIGGKDITPIDLRGGRDFMFDVPSQGMVWASASDVVNNMSNQAQRLKDTYGQDPIFLPYMMQPTGIDFSTFPLDAMVNTARAGMSKTNIKKLDSRIRKILPDWKGVADPTANYAFRTATGDQRKAIQKMMDNEFRDVPGGMSQAEARVVSTDPAQLVDEGGIVTNVGLIDTSRPLVYDSGHPTYIRGLPGEGLGRLEAPVTIFPQSRLRGRDISDNPTAKQRGDALRSMSMSPEVQEGLIDEEFLRAYYD